MTHVAFVISCIFFAYFAIYNLTNLLLLVLAFMGVRKGLRMKGLDEHDLLERSPYTPPVSILVPAYNESVTIEASLKSLMALRFRSEERRVGKECRSRRVAEQ